MKLRAEQFNKGLDAVAARGELSPEEVEANRASVCAPCGNPRCAKWETRLKEYKPCERCVSIAYCSKKCQKAHWKGGHRSQCR